MNRHAKPEVFVVGAGPVGMVMALVLAQEGVNVRIIDKDQGDTTRAYACVLHARTLRALDELGLTDPITRIGRPIRTLGCFNSASRWATLDLEKAGGAVTILPQSDLEEFLEERLARLGVNVEWGHRFIDFAPCAEGLCATVDELTSTGKGYAVPHLDQVVRKRHQISTNYLVGADGRESHVRDHLKINLKRLGPNNYFHMYELKSSGELPDEMRLVFDSSTVNLFTPLPDNHCRWIFQVPPEEVPDDVFLKDRTHLRIVESGRTALNLFEDLVHQRAPWFTVPVEDIEWHGTISFEGRLANAFGRDQCWLAGDVVHLTSPIGMQSMNRGICEGIHLARVLASIVRGKETNEVLRKYDQASRVEWEQLLNPGAITVGPSTLRGGPPVEWLLSSLPATGEDLELLLQQLGIQFKSVARNSRSAQAV